MSRGMAVAALLLLLFVLLPSTPALGVEGDSVIYVGGTLPGLTDAQEGQLDLSSKTVLRFLGVKEEWQAPYSSITKLEYGRKPGRQVAAAIIVSPVWLAAPKRKHFLTLQLKDRNGTVQTGVFELSKVRYVSLIADLEERSGVQVEVEIPEKR